MTHETAPAIWAPARDAARAEYVRRHPRCCEEMARLAKSLPGGDTRNAAWFAPYPLVIDSASGHEMRDVDGNVLLDFLCNYTSLVHGHSPVFIAQAVSNELERGYIFAAPMREQGDLAEQIVGRLASADLVRFTNSGTEATMLASRLASKHTGRQRFAIAAHSYHGAFPPLDWQASSEMGSVVFPVNDIDGAARVFEEAGPLAAIFIEPVLGSGGIITVTSEFLEFLREYATATGAVLVFDEVMTFRLGFGGRQEAVGIQPDLTTLGKIIGGGLPIGAVAGVAEVMEVSDPSKPDHLEHSGTWNGHRLAMVAGTAALRALDRAAVDRLNRRGDRLAAGIEAVAARHSVPVSVSSCGSMLNLHATRDVRTPGQASEAADSALAECLHLGLINHGIFIAMRGEMCLSTPMTDETIDCAVSAVDTVLADLDQYAD